MRLLTGLFLLCSAIAADDRRIPIQNDYVRVLDVVDPPHSKTGRHEHAMNRVMIYLDAGTQRITFDRGGPQVHNWKRGEVFWSPAGGMHVSENIGNTPIRIIEIELTKPVGNFRLSALDPTRVDPAHYRVVLENDSVRVFRGRLPAKYAAPEHEHLGPRVTVFLTDAKFEGGAVSLAQRGDMLWGTAVKHADHNMADHEVEMVVVEPK